MSMNDLPTLSSQGLVPKVLLYMHMRSPEIHCVLVFLQDPTENRRTEHLDECIRSSLHLSANPGPRVAWPMS